MNPLTSLPELSSHRHFVAREEGITQGIVIGKVDIVMKVLSKRFGDVPSTIHEKLHTIHDFDELGQLTDIALDCETLEEFEQALNK